METRFKFYQENLQPLQDSLNQIRESIESISSSIVQDNSMDGGLNEVLTQIDLKIKELVSA